MEVIVGQLSGPDVDEKGAGAVELVAKEGLDDESGWPVGKLAEAGCPEEKETEERKTGDSGLGRPVVAEPEAWECLWSVAPTAAKEKKLLLNVCYKCARVECGAMNEVLAGEKPRSCDACNGCGGCGGLWCLQHSECRLRCVLKHPFDYPETFREKEQVRLNRPVPSNKKTSNRVLLIRPVFSFPVGRVAFLVFITILLFRTFNLLFFK